MSKIISFSVDDSFAQSLENLIDASGYQNRSRFLRDAAVAFAEMKRRGELSEMADEEVVEGHLVVYYQHDAEGKLLEIRHSNQLRRPPTITVALTTATRVSISCTPLAMLQASDRPLKPSTTRPTSTR